MNRGMEQTEENKRFLMTIYHEQQSGALCAVHAVNALIQKREWNEFQLAEIARGLDEKEHSVMLEKGVTNDYKDFSNQESSNYDDSGFFSIQVVVKALEVNGIRLTHILKTDMKEARASPVKEMGFICNYRAHWFTIRKIGTGNNAYWFNLNSTFKYPEYLSNTYLSLFLEQLINDKYTVFVARGRFNQCAGDRVAHLFNASKYINPKDKYIKKKIDYSNISNEKEREELKRAIEMSKSELDNDGSIDSPGTRDLKKALELSLMDGQKGEMKDEEEDELQKAIRMSLMEDEKRMKEKEEEEKKKNEEKVVEMKKKFEAEPTEGDIVVIRFRTANGEIIDRKFLESDTVGTFFDFLCVQGINALSLFVQFPKLQLLPADKDKSLKDSGITGKVQVMVNT